MLSGLFRSLLLLFKNGGSDEYKAAADKIFDEILKLGGYSRNVKENDIED